MCINLITINHTVLIFPHMFNRIWICNLERVSLSSSFALTDVVLCFVYFLFFTLLFSAGYPYTLGGLVTQFQCSVYDTHTVGLTIMPPWTRTLKLLLFVIYKQNLKSLLYYRMYFLTYSHTKLISSCTDKGHHTIADKKILKGTFVHHALLTPTHQFWVRAWFLCTE